MDIHCSFLNANLGETPQGYVKTVNKLLFSLTVVTVSRSSCLTSQCFTFEKPSQPCEDSTTKSLLHIRILYSSRKSNLASFRFPFQSSQIELSQVHRKREPKIAIKKVNSDTSNLQCINRCWDGFICITQLHFIHCIDIMRLQDLTDTHTGQVFHIIVL